MVYSNIRMVLKQFFNQFNLELQRLSLKLSQAISILQIFENFMFIQSINLSGRSIFFSLVPSFIFSLENHLTDEIFDQLIQLPLDHLKTLNLSKNHFTSLGIRRLFEQKSMVCYHFHSILTKSFLNI